MKKACFPLLIALLWTSALTAQSERGSKYGFRLSTGVAWLNPDMSDVGNKARGAFGFGATVDLPLTSNLALSTGLGGNFTGGTLKFPQHAVPVRDTSKSSNAFINEGVYKLRYVKAPLTFKGMTNKIGHLRYFLEFGGSLAYNYYARLDMKNVQITGSSFEKQEDYPIKGMVRNLRVTMVIRAGAEYNISGSTNLAFSATFDNGLTNTFNPKEAPTFVANSNNLPKRDDNGDLMGSDKMKAVANSITVDVAVLF
ncbi:MAG: porin family protein [Flavobacteriales bacterium]